jgi:hypothetical protein
MEKVFIPYEQALALKELGFNEPCIATHGYLELYVNTDDGHLKAPLYQQAFRWFREKHGLCHFINFSGDGFCSGWEDKGFNEHGFENFKTYEEAELECLKKLIEIVKNH